MWQCKIVSQKNHKILKTKNKSVDDIFFPGFHNELYAILVELFKFVISSRVPLVYSRANLDFRVHLSSNKGLRGSRRL